MSDNVETVETNTEQQQPQTNALAVEPKPVLNGAIVDPFEARARRMGWVAKDEFRGDGGAQWVDAETFIKRAEQSADILVERNKALDRRLEQSQKDFTDYKKTSEKQLSDMSTQIKELHETLVDFRNFASTANERAYKRARTELEGEMRQAVAAADMERFDKAKAQVDELDKEATQYVKQETRREQREQREEQPAAQPAQRADTAPVQPPDAAAAPPPPPPEVLAWLSRNQWFVNPEFAYMNQYAQRMHMQLLRDQPGISLSDNLERVTELTKRKFPEEFGINPRREEPAATVTAATSTTRQGGKKKLGYDDLPPDAKAACDKFCRMIPGYDKDEYIKVYFAGEEEA